MLTTWVINNLLSLFMFAGFLLWRMRIGILKTPPKKTREYEDGKSNLISQDSLVQINAFVLLQQEIMRAEKENELLRAQNRCANMQIEQLRSGKKGLQI